MRNVQRPLPKPVTRQSICADQSVRVGFQKFASFAERRALRTFGIYTPSGTSNFDQQVCRYKALLLGVKRNCVPPGMLET